MKSGSDRIVLALVIVLGVIVLGVVVTIIIEALNPAEMSEIGQQVSVFFATVGGAIVGVAGGYVTHSAPKMPWEVRDVESSVAVVEPQGAEPLPEGDEVAGDPPLVGPVVDQEPVTQYSSGDESYGGTGTITEDVTAEFLGDDSRA